MKPLFRILSYLAPYRSLVMVTFCCAAFTTALDLLPPWLIKVIIDDVIPTGDVDLLSWVLIGLFFALGSKNLFNSLRIRFNNKLEQQVVFDLRGQVFSALQRLSLNYFENRSTGENMSRVTNDTEHVERIFIDGLEGMLTASLTLVGYYHHSVCRELEVGVIGPNPGPHSHRDRGVVHQSGPWLLS